MNYHGERNAVSERANLIEQVAVSERNVVSTIGTRSPSIGHGFREWIAASGAAESRKQSQRAKREIREQKAAAESIPEIKRHGFREQCSHSELSTVSGLMSYSLICAHSLKRFSCIPQLTDFFAFFTQWPPAQR